MQAPATPPTPVSGGFDPMVIGIVAAVLFVLLVGFVLYMRWQARAYGSHKPKR